jgi:hypothetical protein
MKEIQMEILLKKLLSAYMVFAAATMAYGMEDAGNPGSSQAQLSRDSFEHEYDPNNINTIWDRETKSRVLITPPTLLRVAKPMPQDVAESAHGFYHKHKSVFDVLLEAPQFANYGQQKARKEQSLKDAGLDNLSRTNIAVKVQGFRAPLIAKVASDGNQVAQLFCLADKEGLLRDIHGGKARFDDKAYAGVPVVETYHNFTRIGTRKRGDELLQADPECAQYLVLPEAYAFRPNTSLPAIDSNCIVFEREVKGNHLVDFSTRNHDPIPAQMKQLTYGHVKALFKATMYMALWDTKDNARLTIPANENDIVKLILNDFEDQDGDTDFCNSSLRRLLHKLACGIGSGSLLFKDYQELARMWAYQIITNRQALIISERKNTRFIEGLAHIVDPIRGEFDKVYNDLPSYQKEYASLEEKERAELAKKIKNSNNNNA